MAAKSIRQLLKDNEAVPTISNTNIYKELDNRALHKHEQDIISERVKLQQQMRARYEANERKRKIDNLVATFKPKLNRAEAAKALDEFAGDEEDTHLALSSSRYMTKVKKAVEKEALDNAATRAAKQASKAAKPPPRKDPAVLPPKIVDPAQLDASIIVGTFSGRAKGTSGADVKAVNHSRPSDLAAADFNAKATIERFLSRQGPSQGGDKAPAGPLGSIRLPSPLIADVRARPVLPQAIARLTACEWAELGDEEILGRVSAYRVAPCVVLAILHEMRRHSAHRGRADMLHALYKSVLTPQQYSQATAEHHAGLRGAVPAQPSPPVAMQHFAGGNEENCSVQPGEGSLTPGGAGAQAACADLCKAYIGASGPLDPRSDLRQVSQAAQGGVNPGGYNTAATVSVAAPGPLFQISTLLPGPSPQARDAATEQVQLAASAPNQEHATSSGAAAVPPSTVPHLGAAEGLQAVPVALIAATADPCCDSARADAELEAATMPSPDADDSDIETITEDSLADKPSLGKGAGGDGQALAASLLVCASSALQPVAIPAMDVRTGRSGPTLGACMTAAAALGAPEEAQPAACQPCVASLPTIKTNRGRVKQPSQRKCLVITLGELRPDGANGWFNSGYIFPDGFHSRTAFRSSVQLDVQVPHDCFILGEGGTFWPSPTFMIVAADRKDEPIVGKSCSACWRQILKRISSEIERRRSLGEDLAPAPKTAIAGPEYFGLNNNGELIEELDRDHLCTTYWMGKEQRATSQAVARPRKGSGKANVKGDGHNDFDAEICARAIKRRRQEAAAEEADAQESGLGFAWSNLSRTERYRKRCEQAGETGTADVGHDNPLPDFMDPITLETVVTPAIAPSGHVMGMGTWRMVIAEQGKNPFTQEPLQLHQLALLTASNIDKYRDRIINM